jgi:prolyl oligopeptidase
VVDAWEPSPEGNLLAYQLSAGGTEESLLWVLDVASGQVVDGPIDRVRRAAVGWLPGGEQFYYVRRLPGHLHPGEENYHRRVYLHDIGSDPAADLIVFGEGRAKTQSYDLAVTADGRWLSITAAMGSSRDTDIYLADLALAPAARPVFRAIQESVPARTTVHIEPGTGPGDPVWLCTDRGAPRGRVVTIAAGDPVAAWRELIPERPDAVLASFAVLAGPDPARPIGVVLWIRHAVSEITTHDLADGRLLGHVPLPGVGSVSAIVAEPAGGHAGWFLYTDHHTPSTLYRLDGRSGHARACGPPGTGSPGAGPDREGVVACQVEFPSRDGTIVRMFIVAPGPHRDHPRPAILTGYGGFGASMTPGFSPHAVAWARAGGIFATACVRGGGEEGAEWHRAGQRENKPNVIDDFTAAAEYLTASGWTAPAQLGIMGASNGGLLVGAALTRDPRRYAAVVCMSPLLDMARYQLSGLGPSWVPEYGSADDPAQLRALLSYSPYHHVAAGASYPPVLFTVADGDTRVDPMHARKMCAALQHGSSGPGPVLLRAEAGAGHGVRAISGEMALWADCLAFFAHHLDLAGPGPTGSDEP